MVFPTRTIEENVNVNKIDEVAFRLFDFLSKTYDNLSSPQVIASTTNGSISNSDREFKWGSTGLVANKYSNGNYYLSISNNSPNRGTYKIISNSINFITIDTNGLKGIFDNKNENNINASIILGENSTLRKVNYMDLVNQNIDQGFREPYFLLADVSDFARYDFQQVIEFDDGVIDSINNPYTIESNSSNFNFRLENYILYISSNSNKGLHIIHSNETKKLFIKAPAFKEESIGNLNCKIFHPLQGNLITNPLRLTGRGIITIELESEEASDEVFYKVRINTLPVFINWAYFVLNYIVHGVYSFIE